MAEPCPEIHVVLRRVEALLREARPNEALTLLPTAGSRDPLLRNAEAVCRLRLGEHEQAIMIFRDLVLSGLRLRHDIPMGLQTNYAAALLSAENLEGCEWILSEIVRQGDTNDMFDTLRRGINSWRASLSFADKLKMWFLGVRKPILPPGFVPGEIVMPTAPPPV